MEKLYRLKHALALYYGVPLTIPFRQFRNGAIYFAVGLGTILMANSVMAPSAQQEWVVLGGLVIGGCGFVLAMVAQLRLLIGRIVQFYQRKD